MRALVFLLLAAALAGCSSVNTQRSPAVDLARYQRFFVERTLTDNHRLDEQIVAELRRLGREASSGPLTMKPDNADAIITYNDRWAEDWKKYLIDLHVEVRDARTDKPLAAARFYQPSITPKEPPEMIREILAQLLGGSGGSGGSGKAK